MTNTTIVRLSRVQVETGYSKSTIYLRIKEGLLPPPIALGKRARGWPLAEVTAINKARVSGATDDKIRVLVSELVTDRKSEKGSVL